VMMGNLLTTLGAEPEADLEMFGELGLNVARQPDNATNPRPDNRSGWLEGETPDILAAHLNDAQSSPVAQQTTSAASETIDLKIRLWDPSTQLRYRAKRKVPRRPDGAPNANPQRRSEAEANPNSDHAPDLVSAG
jgi:biotin synthase